MTLHLVHDLNNLLTVMSGSLDLIASGATPIQLQAEHVVLRRALDSAAEIAKEIAAPIGARADKRQPVDVNLLIAETVPMLRRALRPNALLEIKLEATPGTVFVKPLDLERVLLNLTLNASKAMADGGVLTVTTETLATETQAVTADSPSGLGYVRLTVRDTGCGLDADAQRLMQNPLNARKVQGMGLASVSLLVMRMHGRLRYDCPPTGGTTFHIDLLALDRAD